MPRNSKRKAQLIAARENKAAKVEESTTTFESATFSEDDSGSDFDFESALAGDKSAMFREFVGEWVSSLTRENVYSLTMLLFHMLHEELQFQHLKL